MTPTAFDKRAAAVAAVRVLSHLAVRVPAVLMRGTTTSYTDGDAVGTTTEGSALLG